MKNTLCCLNLSLLGLILIAGASQGHPGHTHLTFGQKIYHIENDKLTNWYDSFKVCAKIDMLPVSIESRKELDYLKYEIGKVEEDVHFWTSGLNANNTDVYWVGTQQLATYQEWKSDIPEQYLLCITLNYELFYEDYRCEELANVICECHQYRRTYPSAININSIVEPFYNIRMGFFISSIFPDLQLNDVYKN